MTTLAEDWAIKAWERAAAHAGAPTDLTADQIDLFHYLVDKHVDLIPQPYKITPRDAFQNADLEVGDATREQMSTAVASGYAHYFRRWTKTVPPIFTSARVERLSPVEQHQQEVAGFVASDAMTMFLAGPVGTGKSYAAWAVGHLAVARDPRALVLGWSTPRLLVEMRPGGNDTAFDRACTADLLILDDIAAAKPTDWSAEQLYSIAEARTASGKRTVITTNASYDDLCQTWGEPMMDRWRHKSVTAVFRGKSRRQPLW